MTWRLGKTKITLDVPGMLIVTAMLIADRSGAMSMALAACCMHEGGHAVAMMLLGVPLRTIRLCPWGIRMERGGGEIERNQSVRIALSGPLVNWIAAVMLWPVSLRFAAVQAVCGLFNLLPLEGMDGGDLLDLILLQRLPERKAAVIRTAITATLGTVCGAAGVYLLLLGGNPTLLLAALYLLFMLIWQCKSRDR